MGKTLLYCHNLIPIELYQSNKAGNKDDASPLVSENPSNSNSIIVTTNGDEGIPALQSSDFAKVSSYDPMELKAYLSQIFVEKRIATDLPTIFEAQQITGEVFLTLNKSTIKEICPSASFGVVTTLTLLIDKLCSEISLTPSNVEAGISQSSKLEKLRNFKCEVGISDSYMQGYFIDLKKSKSLMKLDPLQHFCLLQEVEFEKEKEIALQMLSSKLITFISACINDHQDGTIYFGINPESGCIEGLAVKEDEVINSVNYYIERAFPDENFKSIVHNTMRQPALVPVLDASHSKTDTFVVEIDVVADSIFIQNNYLITKLKDLICVPKSARKKFKSSYFSFDEHNEPILIRTDKQKEFFDQVNIASQARKKEEETEQSPPHEDIRQQLLNNLTGGRPKLEDSIYPFIFLSPVDTSKNKENVTKNLQFIKILETDVVFDFDPKSSSQGIYHCYEKAQGELLTVLTLDNFNDLENTNESRKLIDSIDTDKILWVFCNGYEPLSFEPRPPTEWNKNVKTAFQKALKHLTKNCPKNRILIIICLFSKDYETMLEGCEEIFTSFPNQWVVYAETEQIVDSFKREMIQRKKVDKNEDLHRFVIGMTWEQINNTIEQVTHQADTNGCILPQAAGTFTKPIPDKKLKSWCDIELLSSADPEVSEDLSKSKKVMESFYKGESVDWLNFWFEGQVLQRTHHQRLLDLVEKALTTEEENKVSTVILFHHPGSGATTSAKHVLWELRKKYRCCVIGTITEETSSQLMEIRHFSEPSQSPKPVLILVDNEDEEKYRQLKLKLETNCKNLNRESGKVFFTMLFCIRKASLPLTVLPHQLLLQQKLTGEEQKRFGEKHKLLTSEFEKNKENIDPKFLISFNILKNNFNHDYILKVIKEFVGDVKDERERNLLSFIALLNKYDPQFRSIPVSCFDTLFKKELEINNQAYKRSTNWEANLSQAVQVLLNISPIKKTRSRSTRISLRVHHRLVADSLLEFLITDTNSLSDLMLNLVNKIIIVDSKTQDFMHLQNIVRDIMIKREFNQVDGKKEMFSPFITQVNKSSGDECSIQIFCDFFDRNHDPFIAQQISRFYITLKNWDKAEIYAQKATELKPKCSILWDTFGQVYKAQLIDELENFKKNTDKSKKHDNKFVQKLIALAQKAIFYFKQVQRINEENPSEINENNVAGYFGEFKNSNYVSSFTEELSMFQRS